VVEGILADPMAAEGILRIHQLELTVLMRDIRGFTTLPPQRSEAARASCMYASSTSTSAPWWRWWASTAARSTNSSATR
jgi:hypothetical protein